MFRVNLFARGVDYCVSSFLLKKEPSTGVHRLGRYYLSSHLLTLAFGNSSGRASLGGQRAGFLGRLDTLRGAGLLVF